MAGIKKKVDLECRRVFQIGPAKFAGVYTNIILDSDAIRIALDNKAFVKEVLRNGKRAPLDYTNYNKRNTMGVDVEGQSVDNIGAKQYHVHSIRPVDNSLAKANQPPVTMQIGNKPVDNIQQVTTPPNITQTPADTMIPGVRDSALESNIKPITKEEFKEKQANIYNIPSITPENIKPEKLDDPLISSNNNNGNNNNKNNKHKK